MSFKHRNLLRFQLRLLYAMVITAPELHLVSACGTTDLGIFFFHNYVSAWTQSSIWRKRAEGRKQIGSAGNEIDTE